jgi:hypothetical protein
VRDGRVYARFYDSGRILVAADGSSLGSFPSGRAVAVSGDTGFFQTPPPLTPGGTLYARSVSSGSGLWQFQGDGQLSISPVVVDGRVYAGSGGGWLYALDPASGSPVWCTNVGQGLPIADEHNYSRPVAGFGAGEGMLLVPVGRWLVAYESGGSGGCPDSTSPGPLAGIQSTAPLTGSGAAPAGGPALTLRANHRDRFFGQSVVLSGVLTGAGLAAGQPLCLEGDGWPYDGFKTVAQAVTGTGGAFRFRVRPSRNFLYRVVADTSPPATTLQIFTDVAVLLRRVRLGGGLFRERAQVSGPRDLRLGGRTLHFYTAARGSRSVLHRARATLRGVRSGRFRAAATLRVIGSPQRTRVIICLRERRPDAWGRPDPLDPRCGARRLPIRV